MWCNPAVYEGQLLHYVEPFVSERWSVTPLARGEMSLLAEDQRARLTNLVSQLPDFGVVPIAAPTPLHVQGTTTSSVRGPSEASLRS